MEFILLVKEEGMYNENDPLAPFKFLFSEDELINLGKLSSENIKNKLKSIKGVRLLASEIMIQDNLKLVAFEIEVEKDSNFFKYINKMPSNVQILFKKNCPNGSINIIEFIAKFKGRRWKLHKNDPHKCPRIHAHDYENNEVIDLETGTIHNAVNRKLIIGRIKEKDLIILRELLKVQDD